MSRALRESSSAKDAGGGSKCHTKQHPARDALAASSSSPTCKIAKERRTNDLSPQIKRIADNASSGAAGTERRRASNASSQRHHRRDVERRSSASAAVGPPSSVGFSGRSFDDSRYWDYAFRRTQRQDIGNQCRECKRPFLSLNEEIAVRRYDRYKPRTYVLSSGDTRT